MRRRTFDALAVGAGLVIAALLLVAGGLLTWGHSFVSSEVHTQLAAQKIVFPADNSPAIKAPEFAAMHQYAGQLMTNGAQAEVYADHFIANHLREIGGGKTYAQLSEASLANPKNTALAGQVQTMFRGETLRGLLLNAYAFWQMGQIMIRRRGPDADPFRAGNLAPAARRPRSRGAPQAGHPRPVERRLTVRRRLTRMPGRRPGVAGRRPGAGATCRTV